MNILKQWVWPVVAGFVVASIIMLIFEWINHYLFPLPGGLDPMDTAAVQAFTASLPWTVYILVFVGWAFGAFEGGCTTAWLGKGKQIQLVSVLAAILVAAGTFDMTVLGFPMIAIVLGILVLAAFPYLGRLAMNTFMKRKMAAMAATNTSQV